MDAAVRNLVRERAGNRCEYCRLPQECYDLTFHVEHVVASQHKQDDDPSNLALACDRCNLHKGTNLVTIDHETGEQVQLFNPRTESWDEHFSLVGAEIVGTSPTGIATARLLQMNSERRIRLESLTFADGTGHLTLPHFSRGVPIFAPIGIASMTSCRWRSWSWVSVTPTAASM